MNSEELTAAIMAAIKAALATQAQEAPNGCKDCLCRSAECECGEQKETPVKNGWF